MWITTGGTTRYGPCTSVETSHSTHMLRIRWNEVGAVLFSPVIFEVGMRSGGGICIGVHISEVGDKKSVGKGDSEFWQKRFRVQVGC